MENIITATVLILCILLIRRIFRGRISSRLQYALWLLAALRLMVPASVQIDLGPLTQLRPVDLVRQMESEQGGIVERLEEPIHVTVDSQGMLYRLIGTDAQKKEMADALADMPDDGSTSMFMAGTLGFSWLDVLRALWVAGMLAVGFWIAVSNFVFSRKLKRSRKPFALPEEEIAGLMKREDGSELFRKKGKIRLPAVYLAENISSPCLYGLLGREAVYLTEEVAEDSGRLRHVLVHELVHKKHGDSFWALLRGILVTVYWFHPLVWVAAVCSKRDCELACDEGALALLGEEERISYGETLLSIITRKSRLSDLVCTATTMTGSGKSVKERIRFIAGKPRVIYAAVAAVILIMAAVCVFVFTQNPGFRGAVVDETEGLTVTGEDMQVQLPASIGGISGCTVEEGSGDVVVYHIKTQREVGRFSKMTFRDAIELVDEGREVVPIGDQGYNYLLRIYMRGPMVSMVRTEHTYTPAEETQHTYTTADEETDTYEEETWRTYTPVNEESGVLAHEDLYVSEEGMETQPVGGQESVTQHTYTPVEEDSQGILGHESAAGETGVAGTDSNDGIGSGDGETSPSDGEEAVEYLPNETITVTEYWPREIGLDEKDASCYVYVGADYGRVKEEYAQEVEFIDGELRKAADGVIILSLNRQRREALFDALTENRTPYLGDNSKVGALLGALPLPPTLNRAEGFSVQTAEEPYSLRFQYEMSTDNYTKEDQDMVYFNAAMLFYAVGNVEEITVEIAYPSGKEPMVLVYSRDALEEEIPGLRDADYENDQVFRDKLAELNAEIEAYLAQ